MQRYLDAIPAAAVGRLKVATFDTRLTMKFARIFGMRPFGMAKAFGERASELTSEPQGFIVKGREGPLAEGEIDRARAWGKELATA